MSVIEGRQIECRPNRFTITWAQLIVKMRIGWIGKIFQLRYTPTFQLSCQSSEYHPVLPDSGSVFSPISFPVELKHLFFGSETKSSQTYQITEVHTINRKNVQRLVTQRLPERTYKLNLLVHRSNPPPANNFKQNSRIGSMPSLWIVKR